MLDEMKEKIISAACAVFCCSAALVDMFLLDFDLGYFADNIMWFVVMIGVIIINVRTLIVNINEYMAWKS